MIRARHTASKLPRVLYVCAYATNAVAMPTFIVWLYLSMPATLVPEDMRNLPANELPISFAERYGFVFHGFVYCMFLGFLSQSLAFFPGLCTVTSRAPNEDEFFLSPAGQTAEALQSLSALTAFSVAASEPRSLILRNWVGKLAMHSRLKVDVLRDTANPGALRLLTDVEANNPPLLVDVFADEKHSSTTRSLWEAWSAFAATSPDLVFLSKWTACQVHMSMQEAMNTANPFDPCMLHFDCGLSIEQLARVVNLTSEALEEVITAEAYSCRCPDRESITLSDESLTALAALRLEYFQPKCHTNAHEKWGDLVLEKRFSFHEQAMAMYYLARGKPSEPEGLPFKTRVIAEGHWVCLREAYFTESRPERSEAKTQFWKWARSAICDPAKSDWENLRCCYAQVKTVSGNRVELSALSEGMRLYINECPRLPDEASRVDLVMPAHCLEPYMPARGKAGALNFSVRLLASRSVLKHESLFAIFDARHMPLHKFWYWCLPSFFTKKPEGGYDLNSAVSFVQAPQTFAKMPGTVDYLDLQNGFFYNVMNQMRNKCGAVTSCGTNAVWLLPSKDRLPYVGQSQDEIWWKTPFFEELTKIEDTATSHRMIAEGKHSLYVNPQAHIMDREDSRALASMGVAKQGPDYLAALERWCEGAVQLFWVTLCRGPGRGPCLAIFAYCFAWFLFLGWLIFVQPLVFCGEGSPLTAPLCETFVKTYGALQYNYKRDYDQNEAWKLMNGKVALQLLESCLWVTCFVVFSALMLVRLPSLDQLARYVVMYDNMTNYWSSTTCFYWVFVNVYLALGFASPFRFDIAWLCVWFALLTACRWTLLYSAKCQGNCPGLSLWRSQALWLLNAPLQVMAMVQGTKAAYDILVRSVDKSWWIDPKETVKGLAKAWSVMVFLFAPASMLVVLWSWRQGDLQQQQVVSMILLFYTACQLARPMFYIWNNQYLLSLSCNPCRRCRPTKTSRGSTWATTTLRASVEVAMPVLVAAALLSTKPTQPSQLNLSPIARHGWLNIRGTQIIDEYGGHAALRGVSLFWSQWQPEFWNFETVKWLRDDWNISLIRAAMGVEVEVDGYIKNPSLEKKKVERVVQAAIANGVYVIIDWHVEQIRRGTDVHPNSTDIGGHDKVHKKFALNFFAEMSEKYGDHPNILYELWDEPTAENWKDEIKPYYEETVSIIRSGEQAARRRRDPTIAPKTQGVIILGTRHYSADVDDASRDMLAGENLAYALHFYQVGTPKDREWFRVRTWNALARGAPIFVSEWGSSACSQGAEEIDEQETLLWLSFLREFNISSANWAVSAKGESCSLLRSGAAATGHWAAEQIAPAGHFIRAFMRGEVEVPAGAGCAGHICPACVAFSYTECMQGNSTEHCGYCNFCCQGHPSLTRAAAMSPRALDIHIE
eukprot:TRINITY_DN25737_c0_g1_i1.p1 TRINITY_DN25737_c0_g1~~TRINITY_DN25737_c0_g1_i1.p1  ORF type:complete len:1396 (+),score=159.09 TRINITY_DN25737_c0_g1_i1:31-4218(+)